MIQTRKANPARPVRVMIYGVEGVGKSTLGARAEKPIFISPEGGVDQLKDVSGNPVDELLVDGKPIRDWTNVVRGIVSLYKEEHPYKTLVLDSADWLETLAHTQIVGNSGKTITTVNGGYGSGYRQSQLMHKNLIADLSQLREKGMNIVVTAHTHVKTVKDPEMLEDYDAFEIKCHEMVSSLWREWVDVLAFARFKTFLHQDEGSAKARALGDGDKRVVYTVKRPAFQAKNRYGMPSEMPFTENFWNEIEKYAKQGVVQEKIEDVIAECKEMMKKCAPAIQEKSEAFIVANGANFKDMVDLRARLRGIVGENA